jgi:hypothetical protein
MCVSADPICSLSMNRLLIIRCKVQCVEVNTVQSPKSKETVLNLKPQTSNLYFLNTLHSKLHFVLTVILRIHVLKHFKPFILLSFGSIFLNCGHVYGGLIQNILHYIDRRLRSYRECNGI